MGWTEPSQSDVASYLAEHIDASVALIEAGDMDRDPLIHIPAGFAKMLANAKHIWNYETVPKHGAKRLYASGKVLAAAPRLGSEPIKVMLGY